MGTLNYTQALAELADNESVTRPALAARNGGKATIISLKEGQNTLRVSDVTALPNFTDSKFVPTADDQSATDWEVVA